MIKERKLLERASDFMHEFSMVGKEKVYLEKMDLLEDIEMALSATDKNGE